MRWLNIYAIHHTDGPKTNTFRLLTVVYFATIYLHSENEIIHDDNVYSVNGRMTEFCSGS